MRVLVVGGGGREHALVHSFAQSPLAERIFCAPGNAGTAAEADNIPIAADDLPALLDFASRENVDLTVIGPEAPLVVGLTDLFEEHGLAVFGPNKEASQLEGSKVFAKEVMADGGVATGAYRRHERLEPALADVEGREDYPLVVKADGLAAGKGVLICKDKDEAREAVRACFVAREFGEAGDVLIAEEYLTGSEVSLLVLCDGETAVPLAPAQDYKRIFAGDQGPNTGGMGSYCPVPGFEQKAIDAAHGPRRRAGRRRAAPARRHVSRRAVRRPHRHRRRRQGARVQLPLRRPRDAGGAAAARLRPARALRRRRATASSAAAKVLWKPQDCVTVVLASAGYPASSHKGDVISGLAEAAALDGVTVYHAGTALQDGDVVTAGGRVLAVSALGDGFEAARARAYAGVDKITFDGRQVRPDIAERAVKARAGELDLFPAGFAG